MPYAHLASRRLIRISGADALSFLQSVVSCDVRPAFAGVGVYGALLSPQGKFLHDFFLYPFAAGVVMDCDGARASDLFARLKMYRLRSQVELELLPEDQGVYALWGDDAQGQETYADPRMAQMGARSLQQPTGTRLSEAEYHHHRLVCAVPDGAHDMIVDRTLLLDVGFDQLHGVDFNKGCYIGQEVTARSKFRGQVRKGLYSVCIEGALPEAGTAISLAGQEVGLLRSVSAGIGLAIINHDAVEKSKEIGEPLHAGPVALEVAVPHWMRD